MYNDKVNFGEFILAIIITIALIILFSNLDSPPEKDHQNPPKAGFQQKGDEGLSIFAGGDNELIHAQTQEIKQIETTPIYSLTTEERDLIERVVMELAGQDDDITQKAIAQCILNACNIMDQRPDYIMKILRYPSDGQNPSDRVKESVSKIFDDGELVFGKEIIYFYSPIQTCSQWHETQKYMCTIGNYKFFKEWDED